MKYVFRWSCSQSYCKVIIVEWKRYYNNFQEHDLAVLWLKRPWNGFFLGTTRLQTSNEQINSCWSCKSMFNVHKKVCTRNWRKYKIQTFWDQDFVLSYHGTVWPWWGRALVIWNPDLKHIKWKLHKKWQNNWTFLDPINLAFWEFLHCFFLSLPVFLPFSLFQFFEEDGVPAHIHKKILKC